MKKFLLLLSMFIFSSNVFALSCSGFDIDEEIENADYIFKGKLSRKEIVTVNGAEYTKNYFVASEILKGNPDSFSVRTMKFEDPRLPDGRHDWSKFDYSGYNQVEKDAEYFVFGNYDKDSYSGPCGGYIFKPYDYVLEPLKRNLNYIYDKEPLSLEKDIKFYLD